MKCCLILDHSREYCENVALQLALNNFTDKEIEVYKSNNFIKDNEDIKEYLKYFDWGKEPFIQAKE